MRSYMGTMAHGGAVRRNPQKNQYVLVDTDVWIGLVLRNDPHHKTAIKLLSQIRDQDSQMVITSDIIAETLTVLSHKDGQKTARGFLDFAQEPSKNDLIILPRQEKFFQKALQVFGGQEKKGTSYVDCHNVVIMREFGLDNILSFDKVYHKKFGLNNLAYLKATT
jgi:predicted nucleic acid-binding protein